MASIALNKPSGGQLILSPEDGTSSETVTIPSVGVGKVLQVVNTHTAPTAHLSTSSTAYGEAPSSYSVTITPKQIGSKMLITINIGMQYSDTNQGCICAVAKNGAVVTTNQYPSFQKVINSASYSNMHIEYVDTDITSLSPITYNLAYKSENGGYVVASHDAGRMNITVMEVAA